ncbi:MAG TPA: AMP-binding protein, partial [Acidimicrobiales bacterium]|nr:AMP-binding protein [Acidimicrobiales bacterium]
MSDSTPGPSSAQVAQLASMAEHYPDAVGYRVVDGGQLTFGQWESQSNRLARGLVAAGVGHGDRVAIRLHGV